MSKVRRLGRVLDLIGLLLFLAGAGTAARAWAGFEEVRTYQATAAGPPFAALRLHDRYARVQRAGVVLMAAGVAVFVAAWWVSRKDGSTPES